MRAIDFPDSAPENVRDFLSCPSIPSASLHTALPTHTFIHPILSERKVKTGFRWPALIFGTLWAFSEGLVEQGGRLMAIDAAVGLLWTLEQPLVAMLLLLAKNIYCGVRASDWLEATLVRAGYRRSALKSLERPFDSH